MEIEPILARTRPAPLARVLASTSPTLARIVALVPSRTARRIFADRHMRSFRLSRALLATCLPEARLRSTGLPPRTWLVNDGRSARSSAAQTTLRRCARWRIGPVGVRSPPGEDVAPRLRVLLR